MINKSDKIYVAGHRGLVGSALVRNFEAKGYTNLVVRTREELDLLDGDAVRKFYREQKPDVVVLAAAKVGGIHANNTKRADFIYQNLMLQTNVVWGAFEAGVREFVFLGSSCIYPKFAPQPMPESCLLTSELEMTNRPYALAKIAGLELIQSLRHQYGCSYFSVMPTNLYGVNDNFHPMDSHVLPAILKRVHDAKVNGDKQLVVWGTGSPLREFMLSDDCADAIIFLLENLRAVDFNGSAFSHVNIGSGQEISILELTKLISKVVGFDGEIVQDLTKPDGTPRKLLDCSFLTQLGWQAKTSLEKGIEKTYEWLKGSQTFRC